MSRRAIRSLAVACLILAGRTCWSQFATSAFQQGSLRFGLDGGYGTINNNGYLILGAGAGYYAWNGVEAGLDADGWFGASPQLYELSPRLTYVFYQAEHYKPYFGVFYRHTFVTTLPDLDSAGLRAGVITPLNNNALLSAGLVYEDYFNCDKTVYADCSQIYPEFSIGFSF